LSVNHGIIEECGGERESLWEGEGSERGINFAWREGEVFLSITFTTFWLTFLFAKIVSRQRFEDSFRVQHDQKKHLDKGGDQRSHRHRAHEQPVRWTQHRPKARRYPEPEGHLTRTGEKSRSRAPL
jgi:hypothetical protein